MTLNMPSVPKADIIAVAQAAIAAAVAFGAPLTPDQQKSLLALATVIAAILVTADVKRRGNRAQNADKIAAATRPALPARLQATGTTVGDAIVAQQREQARQILAPKKPPAKKKAAPKKKP